jgi:hypothetical protein
MLVADCESWTALKPGDAEPVDYVVPEISADADLKGANVRCLR